MNRPRYYKKKRRKQGKFKQGVFIPQNKEKFLPSVDKTMNKINEGMMYRSSWELAFARYLDESEKVIQWGSEPFAIPYISPKDNRQHRYYIDFVFRTEEKRFLIEIKPNKQKKDPVNQAKWEAAQRYADQVGAIFMVITEVELKQMKLI